MENIWTRWVVSRCKQKSYIGSNGPGLEQLVYWLDHALNVPGFGSAQGKNLSSGAYRPSYFRNTGVIPWGIKQQECPSSVAGKNEWKYKSAPPYAFMARTEKNLLLWTLFLQQVRHAIHDHWAYWFLCFRNRANRWFFEDLWIDLLQVAKRFCPV